jgi:hypothetical protein
LKKFPSLLILQATIDVIEPIYQTQLNNYMKRTIIFISLLFSINCFAQDSTMNQLTQGMNTTADSSRRPVKIFEGERLINTNTTELIGKGKMDFRVIHNFYDIGGSGGGLKNFFGFDNAADIKIGFEIGLGKRLDILAARTRGGEPYNNRFSGVKKIWELGLKWKLMEQTEGTGHPLSMALFVNNTIASMQTPIFERVSLGDSAETNYKSFSERQSQVVQLMIAHKAGNVSLQVSGTFVHRNRIIVGDDKSIFALGGAIRIPLSKKLAFIVDYVHPFHSQSSKDFFNTISSTVPQKIKFHDPLGIGFEILTAGHVFHVNFTNAVEILENRMIPRTVTSWGDGQFRWGFTISRTFVLWREKSK